MSDSVYIALETFATEVDGEAVVIQKGTRVRAGHPYVETNPGRFGEVETEPHYDYAPPPPKSGRDAATKTEGSED